ncbi:MAG: Nif3-like dinuclear metal center hexameric protein [Fusobacterium sp.]|nr:Nif3-like dinuclear metal center hexameric protein [Fusobacterium sp.]
MKLREIIKILEKKFPLQNAEDWDNVGLLIGDYDADIKKIQFSLDATLESIENAKNNNVDLIITHHPTIFKAVKNIKEQDVLGKKIRELIKNDINLYTLHTNLDATREGLNDYVLKKLGVENSKILDKIPDEDVGIGRVFSLEKEMSLKDYIEFLKEKLEIKNLRYISNDLEIKIKKIAIVNGSAMKYWRKAKKEKVDLFITGDITYHDALDALESNLSVVDFGHYESENFFYDIIIEVLKDCEIDYIVYNGKAIFEYC